MRVERLPVVLEVHWERLGGRARAGLLGDNRTLAVHYLLHRSCSLLVMVETSQPDLPTFQPSRGVHRACPTKEKNPSNGHRESGRCVMTGVITLSNGARFENAEDRIREYCEIEVYRGYDDQHTIDNRITIEDVRAANELYAMIDRYDSSESSRIVGATNVESALSGVEDSDLAVMDGEKWSKLKSPVRALLAEFLSIKGVGLAKATKILHLKRPHLFPVLDSFVVKFLSGEDPTQIAGKARLVGLGLKVMDEAQADVMRNSEAFAELRTRLLDLPIQLTCARMYDVLCWTQEKWVVRGNPHSKYGVARRSIAK